MERWHIYPTFCKSHPEIAVLVFALLALQRRYVPLMGFGLLYLSIFPPKPEAQTILTFINQQWCRLLRVNMLTSIPALSWVPKTGYIEMHIVANLPANITVLLCISRDNVDANGSSSDSKSSSSESLWALLTTPTPSSTLHYIHMAFKIK